MESGSDNHAPRPPALPPESGRATRWASPNRPGWGQYGREDWRGVPGWAQRGWRGLSRRISVTTPGGGSRLELDVGTGLSQCPSQHEAAHCSIASGPITSGAICSSGGETTRGSVSQGAPHSPHPSPTADTGAALRTAQSHRNSGVRSGRSTRDPTPPNGHQLCPHRQLGPV